MILKLKTIGYWTHLDHSILHNTDELSATHIDLTSYDVTTLAWLRSAKSHNGKNFLFFEKPNLFFVITSSVRRD
jgi:hypothetical protein